MRSAEQGRSPMRFSVLQKFFRSFRNVQSLIDSVSVLFPFGFIVPYIQPAVAADRTCGRRWTRSAWAACGATASGGR
jgi:hypothetical protein